MTTMTTADKLGEYQTRARSWSQLNQYETCPKSYYLERIARAWSKPDAWRPMGTALHAAIEYWEKTPEASLDDALRVAQRAYRQGVQTFLDDTPNSDMWHASGPYKGTEDIPRRYGKLREHLEAYERLTTELPPLRTDLVAVEGEIALDLDGVVVTGYVDQIREGMIVDVKTGSKKPDGPSQLSLYAEAVKQTVGDVITEGAYVMTGAGQRNKMSGSIQRHDLVTVSLEQLTARFHALDDGVKQERFDPKPGEACKRCGVWSSCPEGQKYTQEER